MKNMKTICGGILMSETRYIISDAAKMVDVEPHVLRYWEEELGMEIPRNEMGHRYYTDKEIKTFINVRNLKEKGFQLKAIKMILLTVSENHQANNIISIDEVRKSYNEEEAVENVMAETVETKEKPKEEIKKDEPTQVANSNQLSDVETSLDKVSSEDKMKHFKYIMDSIVMQALKKNNETLEENMTEQITDKVIKEMDYLFRVQEEKEEQRYKQIDEIIRKKQKGRKEVAATQVPGYTSTKTKRGFFRNKNSF